MSKGRRNRRNKRKNALKPCIVHIDKDAALIISIGQIIAKHITESTRQLKITNNN